MYTIRLCWKLLKEEWKAGREENSFHQIPKVYNSELYFVGLPYEKLFNLRSEIILQLHALSFTFKLSEENSVKITDVGISKDAKDITGTLAGTPVYIAPEVFHSKLYDSKADIYSFGIMLWEMWYGRQAFEEFKGTMAQFFSKVDEGYRPKEVKGEKMPPPIWEQLMNRCWLRNPDKRPSAEICNQEIATL